MSERLRRLYAIAAIAITGAIAGGCAPVFQDARLVNPGHVQVTPSFSGAGVSDEGESEYLVNTFAVQVQGGVSERFELGAAYARFEDVEGEGGINTLVFGPRIGVVKDRVAVAVPFSFLFGEDVEVSDTWMIHPTAIFTIPVSPRVDINPSARLVIPLCEECTTSDWLLGFNGGVGLRVNPRLTLRPEAGILVNPGESGVIWTFGFGVSIR